MFSVNADELDRAYDDLKRMSPPEDAWDAVAPNVEFQHAEEENEGVVQEKELLQEDQLRNVDLAPEVSGNRSELHVRFVGADFLNYIHRRLQYICGKSDPDSRFGGVSVMAVGDLYQLQPVGQNHVFGLPRDNYARLHGSLWEENFKLMELTESKRQKDNQRFAQLLMRVRTATCTEDDITLFKTRVIAKERRQ
ncbi:Hypothetical predicted protein [Octopus vulgaris]|uniref:ATP-dependent DNA helicase n=1 Tax=Octopus vulgaris TaxID=6645 RepID=A0AA36FBK8_OCTVU|nr:Hypothetical predicted protein [Octopus vulgaris]